jgi:membrane protease YdiL (CAAX protease family)
MFEQMLTSSSLFDQGFIGSGLLGYVVLALASVGFMVRRDLSATLERLGLRPLASSDYAVIPLGVLLLFGLNLALETVQRTWFTDMWLSDQRVSQLIAAQLGLTQILMLGLSAGVGEEITLRGALQPRLGIWLTSLLFAALHIQYSWFGMGVIFCFGMLLGFIRMRTSTSVVMAIHTLYDIAAVVSMPGPT